MKQSNRFAARCGPAHSAPESGVRRPPSSWRAATLVALLLGTFSLSTPARRVEAGTIPTGATPTDTAIRTDGLVSYVLNSGNSTLSVVNVSNSVVLSTIPLLQPPNACLDIDWSSATSRVLVGCTNGNVLSVDPTTGVVAVAGANGACCFDVICADSLTPGVTGWAIDRNTSRLYMIAAGLALPRAMTGLTSPVELVEKRRNPLAGSALDVNLYALGNVGAAVTLVPYNRTTGIAGAAAAIPGLNATATGVVTSSGAEAYVSANPAVGGGVLYAVALAPLAFAAAPLGAYATPVADVSMAGQFVTAIVQSGGAGATLYVYDAGNPAAVLFAGTLVVSTTVNPAGGLSNWIGSAGTIDDLYTIHANAGPSVTSQDLSAAKAAFVDAAAPTVVSGLEADIQATLSGIPDQEARPCNQCGGQTGGETSGSVFGDGYVMPVSASPASVQYATGEEVFNLPVFQVPGVGVDAAFQLTYRSRRSFDYRYGNGWFFNQDMRLFQQSSGDERAYDGTGRRDTYRSVAGSYVSPLHFDTTMTATSTATTITDRFGTAGGFDTSGRRTSLTDRYGNAISYTWTGDKLTAVTDTLSRAYTLSYDTAGRMSSIADFGGRTWTFRYDYLGQMRSVTTPATTQFPSGRTRFFSYSGNNADARLRSNLVHVWNYRGQPVQTLLYNASDLAVAENLAGGQYSFSYNPAAGTTNVIDCGGETTTWTFDANAMVTKAERSTRGLRVGEPASYVTNYTIGSNGYPSHVVLPGGSRVDYAYDAALNVTEVRWRTTNTSTNATSDLVTTLSYGVYGQVASSTDPLGATTSVTLDSLGNATAVARPTVTVPATQTSSSSMTYDSQGRLLTATDPESRAVALAYYSSGPQKGYVHTITRDPSGLALVTTLEYDAYGNVTAITDARGKRSELTVDDENFVVEAKSASPFSYRTKLTYDADRNVTKTEIENKDRFGTADATTPWIDATATFDPMGRMLTSTRRLDASTTATSSFDYDAAGRVVRTTSPLGNQTQITYDERGLVFQTTSGYGTSIAATTRVDYDLDGHPLTVTDPRSNSVTYTYDAFGRATRFTNELGNYVTFAYDKDGHPTTIQVNSASSTLLASTTRSYDEVGRLWKVANSRFGSGLSTTTPTTTITRDRSDRIVSIEDPLARVSTRAYDAAGRLQTATDPAGDHVDYTYDANGNTTKVEATNDPDGSGSNETFATEFVYDELNRLTAKHEIDRLNSSNVLATNYEYDSRGNLAFLTDAEGHPTRFSYDLAGRLMKRERALSVGTSIDTFVTKIEQAFAYDSEGRLTSQQDDNYGSTGYTIDGRDRVTAVQYPDSQSISYSFDANGNVAGWTDQNGTVVSNTIDAHNRLTARSITRGTNVQGTTSEGYTYDALDRLLTAVDDDFQVENTWDSVGNLLEEKQGYNVSGSEKWKTVGYAYDEAGAPSSISYPSSFAVGHTRDSIDRLTALVDIGASANIATFLWQGVGRLQKTSNQNGTSTNYTYDGFARVATIDHVLAGGTGSLHKFEYAYDKVHNRRMEKNTFDATWVATLPTAVQNFLNPRAGKGDVYAYDWANRLVDARYDVANPLTEIASPGSQTYGKLVAYALDGLGNRSQTQTTVTPGSPVTVTYATDVVNQYTTVGGVSRTHDLNGNLTDDGTHLFKFDYRNHITEARVKSTNALISTYKYDAVARRVEKALSGAGTTRYVLAGGQVVEEYDGSDIWQARYVFEDGVDQLRAMDRADQADVDGDSNVAETARFTYHQSAMECVSEISSASGHVVEWATYDAYGSVTIRNQIGSPISASAIGNPIFFTSRELDSEVALYHLRARNYDAETGRFSERDPVGYVDGMSLYEYSKSNPATLRDPLGLSSGEIHIRVLGVQPAPVSSTATPSNVFQIMTLVIEYGWWKYVTETYEVWHRRKCYRGDLIWVEFREREVLKWVVAFYKYIQVYIGGAMANGLVEEPTIEDVLPPGTDLEDVDLTFSEDGQGKLNWSVVETVNEEDQAPPPFRPHPGLNRWRLLVWSGIVVSAIIPNPELPVAFFGSKLIGPVAGASRIGATGKAGEEALRLLVGGESQVKLATSLGLRVIDQLVRGVAHEAKTGWVKWSAGVGTQIAKDAELLSLGLVESVVWHFFRSAKTGLVGATPSVLRALKAAGIKVVVHSK